MACALSYSFSFSKQQDGHQPVHFDFWPAKKPTG
jgi:hypothetical protein